MPPHPAFLSCVLRLQIRDRNLCCCDAIAARAFRSAGKCRGLSEVLAFRRLQISARDIKSGGCGHDNARAHRKHAAVVRTPARRIGSAIAVNQRAASFQSGVSLLAFRSMHLDAGKTSLATRSPCFRRTSNSLANSARRFRFGKTENRCSIFTVDFATPVARNPGQTTRSCWSGRQRKELAARVCCMRCNNRRLSSNRPVAEFWPEFGQADKDKITLAQLLSHQAGLCALDQRVDVLITTQ